VNLLPGRQSSEFKLAVRLWWTGAVLVFVGAAACGYAVLSGRWTAIAMGGVLAVVGGHVMASGHKAYAASRGNAKAAAHGPRPMTPHRGL
jgi:hypothetical protein